LQVADRKKKLIKFDRSFFGRWIDPKRDLVANERNYIGEGYLFLSVIE